MWGQDWEQMIRHGGTRLKIKDKKHMNKVENRRWKMEGQDWKQRIRSIKTRLKIEDKR